MGLVIFNAALYVLMLFFYWNKHKRLNFFLIVLLIYAATACLCAYNYSLTPYKWNDLGGGACVYLFCILLIFLYPLRKFDFRDNLIMVEGDKKIQTLAIFYVIICFVNIAMSMDKTIELFYSGDWAGVYDDFYADEENVQLYESSFQKLVKNLSNYLSPFAFVYTFYLLTKPKLPKVLFFSLLLSVVIPSFMSATIVASRGMVMFLAIKLFISYLLFSSQIPPKRKRILLLIAAGLLALFLFYSILVTVSRFGEDESSNSLIAYFGHSMLSFNDGIFNNLHDFAWGKRVFKWFIDLLGSDSYFSAAKAGATHGHAFYTFVGGIYIDWGPIGTIIVALITCVFIKRFFEKHVLHLSDSIMIVFYVDFLANGIYAYNSGRALVWIMTYVVYLIVKKMENRYA